jgi:hypothetical protein
VLLIVRAETEAEIAARLDADPWVRSGLLVGTSIHPWRLRLGSLE